jgi:hypothetical protein
MRRQALLSCLARGAKAGAGVLALFASAALCAAVPPDQRNFVACPVLLDTEPVPCWVADYQGERYFLVAQSGRGGGGSINPPQLRHKALIQAAVAQDEPRVCGGIPLKDVKISALVDELDESCNQLLPSGGYHATSYRVIGLDGDPPGPRETTAFQPRFGARKGDEQRKAVYAANAAAGRKMDFDISFFFNSDYIIYPDEQEDVEDALDYAKLLNASRIEITAYREGALLSDGTMLAEKPEIARRRAEKLAMALKDFGWPGEKLSVKWIDTPLNKGGVRDYELCRAQISVIP